MKKSSKIFVGMDVHKESIDIALAEVGGEVRRRGPCGLWIERGISVCVEGRASPRMRGWAAWLLA